MNMQDADYVSCLLEHGCDATSVDLSNLDADGGKISKMVCCIDLLLALAIAHFDNKKIPQILEYQSTSLSSERRALLQNQGS